LVDFSNKKPDEKIKKLLKFGEFGLKDESSSWRIAVEEL